jgi:AcrR family transcriptional regulator
MSPAAQPAPDRTDGRTRRGELSKDGILDVALALADRHGLEAVTMRRIAEQLDLSPMSLYRHIRTKDEIIDGLVDRAWAILEQESQAGVRWDQHLRQVFGHMHRMLLEHPGLVDILLARPAHGLPIYRLIDRTIGVLRAAGFSHEEALLAVATLDSYTFGFTVQQRMRAGRDAASDHPELRKLPPTQFPNLSGFEDSLTGWASEERFGAGLTRLISTLRPDRDPCDHPHPPSDSVRRQR